MVVSRRATSKASLAVLVVSPGMRWLSRMVNWRRLAPVGMVKAWVSSESFWDCSVRVAVPLMMLVAPEVFQPVLVVKSPLDMASKAPAVRWAGLTPVLPNTPTPPLPEMVLIIAQSIVDGSLRMPGLRLVLRRSLG